MTEHYCLSLIESGNVEDKDVQDHIFKNFDALFYSKMCPPPSLPPGSAKRKVIKSNAKKEKKVPQPPAPAFIQGKRRPTTCEIVRYEVISKNSDLHM